MSAACTRFALVMALLLTAGTVHAQSNRGIEIWGAFSGAVDGGSGTLASSYAPTLLFGTAVTSSAEQTLTIDGTHGPGWQVGVNLFPTTHFGAQILVDRATVTLAGANGPYTSALTWISTPPPDYQPQVVSTNYSKPWPDTSGSFTQLTVGFNAVARTTTIGRLAASVSGGLSYYRLTGTAQSLGYTEYHLGGHSTLFDNEMHMAFAFEPTSTIGFNVGGDVTVALAPRIALVAGYRYLAARTIDVPIRLTAVTNPEEIFFSETVDTIAQRMPVPAARIQPSGSRLIVGVKLTP